MRLTNRLTLLTALLLLAGCSGGSAETGIIQDGQEGLDNGSGFEVLNETILQPSDQVQPDFTLDVPGLGDALPELVPQCDPGEGCFLDECTDNSDCISGWCVEHMGKGVCSTACQEECPPGWLCKQVDETGPDVVYMCVSQHANLCKPCNSGADCASVGGADDACIVYEGEGAFCGGACSAEGKSCPGGFTCQTVNTVDGIELDQCVADDGQCECTEKSIALGLWTQCETSNSFGTCTGKRVCTDEGLSECDAPNATPETCDGTDQDCDGLVDEPTQEGGNYVHLCNDDNDCTEDLCNGTEGCANLPLSGTPCNAPDPCSSAFVCQDGTCTGEPKSCDDGKICTVDTCDPEDGHCSHEAKNENCPSSNNPCVSNVFCDPFADETTDPNQDGCVVIYKPAGTGCNDGDACTSGETCQEIGTNLVCIGTPIDFDDDNPCTNDSCDPLTGPVHTPIPDCQAPCEPGEMMTGTCGKCGIHSKICPDTGKWSDAEWGECGGEGLCLPGSQETIMCGNCGVHTHTCNEQCQWGEWGDCINEGACTPGDTQFEACEGQCTSKQRPCTDSCQWGQWGDCQVIGDCTPGESEDQACGNCGNQLRICTDLCFWSDWSECANSGPCIPGEVENQACGNCGSQSRTCTDGCQWSAWTPCADEGVCSPGQAKEQTCGNCGSQTATCGDNCQWNAWTPCAGEGTCSAGETEEVSCGVCAVQVRTCSNSCQWGPWGECVGGGVCSPGQVQEEPCGNCGTQTRTCTDSCMWGNWSNCLDQGVCSPGQAQEQDCGNCGTQSRTCSNSCQWNSWSSCLGQGICSPGQSQEQDCGNCGTQTRSCTNSCAWSSWGSCLGQGVCSPGETESQNCGNCGWQDRECNWNCYWSSWDSCNDPCACDCAGGTCCSNGCDYDPYGTACGGSTCKQCNGNGSCVNKPNGTWCSGGECYSGNCVECLNGQTESCDPNCGVFNDPDEGERTCSNYQWGECKPVWCSNPPVYYPIAPLDHNWHCAIVDQWDPDFHLCVQVNLSWICAEYLEFRLLKSWNIYGTAETGPWDNDLKVIVRNTSNGKSWTQSKVSCAGNTDANGGCYFTVGNSTLTNTLNVTGTDNIKVEIYSPYTSNTPVGTTGTIKIKECY